MATTVAIVVLVLLALALLVAARRSAPPVEVKGTKATRTPGVRPVLAGLGVVALTIAVIWTLAAAVVIVGANEVGVPVSFGRVHGVLPSGPHLVAPWVKVETLPTRPETLTVVAQVRTSEQGFVSVRLSARWATDRANAVELYRQVRTGDDAKIEADIVGPNLVGAAGAFYGRLLNVDAVNGQEWEKNAAGTEEIARRYLAPYGIRLDTVRVREVTPDSATNTAISRIAAQQRETQIAIEAQKTAKAEAERRRIEAEGLAAAARKTKNLTDEEIQLLCLQAAERIQTANAGKNLPTYTLPCQEGSNVIAK